jgi:predicted HTH domain antitoxin
MLMVVVLTLVPQPRLIRTTDRLPLDQVIHMATVTIEVPDEAFAALHRSPQELGREMRLAAAMVWYTQGRISHEKAASFAGVSRIDLIDALAAAKLPAFRVDVDELMEEVELADQAHCEHVTPGLSRPGRSSGDTPVGSQ